jgi:hypothetical protein
VPLEEARAVMDSGVDYLKSTKTVDLVAEVLLAEAAEAAAAAAAGEKAAGT